MKVHAWNLVALLLCLGTAAPAFAADQLLLGSRLFARDTGNTSRIVFISRDGALAVPTGANEPTTAGMTFQLLNPLTGASAAFPMPAQFWRANRFHTKYVYTDRRGIAGFVKKAILRNGRLLKVITDATGISLATPPQGALSVVMVAGTDRYCTLFATSAIRRDVACRFKALRSARPLQCPTGAISSASGAFVAP